MANAVSSPYVLIGLSGGDQPVQQYVNPFGENSAVADIHLYSFRETRQRGENEMAWNHR